MRRGHDMSSRIQHTSRSVQTEPSNDALILVHSGMGQVQEAAPDLALADVAGPRQASELINALISSSYSTRCFSGKWRLIRDKLQQLLSTLAATTPGIDSRSESSELLVLFESVALTLRDVDELLHRCLNESYHGGKLLIRSGLDAVASRIELNNRRLTEIYASGVLSPSQAIVLSKPAMRASREDMRCYVKDVFSRLRIGDSSMRTTALTALHEVLCENENYVRIVALEVTEGLPLLVSFLEFEDTGIQDGAAAVAVAIAESDAYKGALVSAGAVPSLIQMLEKGTKFGKEKAAEALVKLTENSDNVWSVSAHGGVTLLLKLCNDPDSSTELILSSCNVLRNLCGVEEIKRFMLEEGAVPVLIKLSSLKEEVLQMEAMEFIHAMASEDGQIRQIIIREGVIGSAMQLLDPCSSYSSKAREIAFRTTMQLCLVNSMNALLSSDFLDRVLFFLKNGETCVQESALKVVLHVCETSEEHVKRLGDAGFLPEIIRLLQAKSYEVRETAAQILCSMVLIQRNRRYFIKDDSNVNQVMRLLNPDEEKPVPNKLLLPVLMSLSDSNSGRRKIIASGYVHYLERLAESNVLDAKKILKKLFGSRIRNILSGIWSY